MTAALQRGLADAVRAAMPMARELFDDLAAHTAGAKGITRTPYGEGEQYAYDLIARRAAALGLRSATDPAGNLYLTLPGADQAAPCWMIGSHLDSVPNGGNYDGAAGVIAGLAAIAALQSLNVTLLQDVTVMCIRAEEAGSWFSGAHGGHLGSRMALGLLKSSELDTAIRMDSGQSLRTHMQACGFAPERIGQGAPYLDPKRIKGYLEIHIEQGPVLEMKELPVGVVNSIRGNSRLRDARCLGAYNHGGATPQDVRQDAVIATSQLVLGVDRKWRELHATGRDLIFTFGKLFTDPAVHSLSKVPGEVNFSLDMRSGDPEVLALMRDFVREEAARVAAERRVRFDLGEYSITQPTVLDTNLRARLHEGSQALDIAVLDMASGGGHDAQEFTRAGVPSAMIFVRNANGSHVAEEAMTLGDFETATRLLTWMVAGEARG